MTLSGIEKKYDVKKMFGARPAYLSNLVTPVLVDHTSGQAVTVPCERALKT